MVRDQVSQTYKILEVTVLCMAFWSLGFYIGDGKTKHSELYPRSTLQIYSPLDFPENVNSICYVNFFMTIFINISEHNAVEVSYKGTRYTLLGFNSSHKYSFISKNW